MIRFVLSLCFFVGHSYADIAQTSGKGYLEVVEGQTILHLEGTPYEIGYQHGELLKEKISHNLNRFVEKLLSDKAPAIVQNFRANIPSVLPFVPQELLEEIKGMADGSELDYDKILLLNLFPEMFHCSAITVAGEATKNGELYHVRVLDYAMGNGLQDTAVLAIVKPDHGHPFMNVTYAGFIGCVTGMNREKIGIGEIGGKGHGSWKGMPMAFLLRMILQHASSLEDVQKILASTPRTCEYYYIFSDGKSGKAFGAYATADILEYVFPNGKMFNLLDRCASFELPLKDTMLLTRDDQYELLLERVKAAYGHIGVKELQEAILQPVSHSANLHDAIFAPGTLEVWIAHAGRDNEPACEQPYHHFSLEELLRTNSQ